MGILLIRSWNAGHAGPPRVSTEISRVYLLTIISAHVAARPKPAAASIWLPVACAVDLGRARECGREGGGGGVGGREGRGG